MHAGLADVNRAAAAHWQEPDRSADRRMVVIVIAAAILIFAQFHLLVDGPARVVNGIGALGWVDAAGAMGAFFTDPASGSFRLQMVWAAGTILFFLVIPALVVVASGGRLRDFGFRFGGPGDARIYGLLASVMVPLVAIAASIESFRDYYPFYRLKPGEPLWPHFVIFEIAYLVQFVGVEFFFRGFLLHGVKARFGGWSILVPLIPYMMLHFGKPPLEAAAAVIAGLVLGFLSLRTGSIVFGILLHGGVALAMDLSSLAARGLLW